MKKILLLALLLVTPAFAQNHSFQVLYKDESTLIAEDTNIQSLADGKKVANVLMLHNVNGQVSGDLVTTTLDCNLQKFRIDRVVHLDANGQATGVDPSEVMPDFEPVTQRSISATVFEYTCHREVLPSIEAQL